MKKLVVLLWVCLLAITVSAQQFKWPPQSLPLSIPHNVSPEVDYYWGIQRITCIGKASTGYKFRISGIAKHDYDVDRPIDIFYIAPSNRVTMAGAYFFPKVSKGQKFSFDITSASSGYIPAEFKGFFIHDKRLSVPKETSNEEVIKAIGKVQINEDASAIEAIEVAEAEAAARAAKEAETAEPVTEAEQMPAFPGGSYGVMSFLARNIKYPTIAQENGIQGRVIVQVVIDTDGSVTEAKINKGVDPYLDKEALRVVASMPKWTPGKVGDKAVKVRFTFPVIFRLSE